MEPCSSLVAPVAAVCRASAPTYRGKLGRMVRRTRTAHCWRRAGAQCRMVPPMKSEKSKQISSGPPFLALKGIPR